MDPNNRFYISNFQAQMAPEIPFLFWDAETKTV